MIMKFQNVKHACCLFLIATVFYFVKAFQILLAKRNVMEFFSEYDCPLLFNTVQLCGEPAKTAAGVRNERRRTASASDWGAQ